MSNKTFKELAKDKSGTIYEDGFENGVRFIIMRGPAALCAYIGVPNAHPLADRSYDDLPLEVHGGLTFGGGGKGWPEDYYWYGWDYAHSGDRSFYDLDQPFALSSPDDKEWTVEQVKAEIWDATWQFSKLVKLAETIAEKAKSNA